MDEGTHRQPLESSTPIYNRRIAGGRGKYALSRPPATYPAASRWNREEFADRAGIAPTHSAFGADAKLGDGGLSRFDALARAFDPVAPMHQAEKQFRLRLELEIFQSGKERRVGPVARHRHMNPLDGALHTSADPVRDLDQIRHVVRLDEMVMAAIAVAEV